MKHTIIPLIVFLLFPVIAQAQEKQQEETTTPTVVTYPRLHWGFSAGGGTFGYMLKGDNLNTSNSPSFAGNLFLELKFTKWLGVEVGGGYTLLSGKVKLDSYSKTYEGLTDDQGDNLNLTLGVKNMEENLTASLLEIPVSIRLEWNPGKWTLYLKPGVAYTMVQSSKYDQLAVYTRNGYYPEYGVTFTNLASHGFYSNAYHSQGKQKLELKNGINPFIGAGIIFPGTKGRFYIEGKYYPGSIDFAKSETSIRPFDGPGYESMSTEYAFSSATKLSSKIGLGGFMVQLGFRFR
jgi:hypothetical protein